MNNKEVEIPFGAFDSELGGWEYTIPEGFEATIKNGRVIVKRKESEGERIRKELLEEIEFIVPHDDETDSEGLILPSYHVRIDRYKSYLEKQKEQQPAGGSSEKPNRQWSEEDERMCYYVTEAVQIRYSDKELAKYLNLEIIREKRELKKKIFNWLKSLRPQPHWKPSEEQPADLDELINDFLLNNSEFLVERDSKAVVQKLARHFYELGLKERRTNMIDIEFYEIQCRGNYLIQVMASPYVPRIGEVVDLVDNNKSVKTFICEKVLSCFDIKSQRISAPIKVYLRATD